MVNQQVRLAARPSGLPRPSDWEFTSEDVPMPGPGQFTVAVSHLSIDPAMREWLKARPSYIAPVEIGAVMRAGGAGRVIASEHPGFAVGDHVSGAFGVQEHAISDGRGVAKLDLSVAEVPTWLGALGMTGLTAYFALLDTGRAREGDTVVVSGAAGAVGSVAGQIAKIKGCRVIGIAGGPDKCRAVTEEFGFDAAIDYREPHLRRKLRELAPGGVDVYFDNVGGEILDHVLTCLARGARVVICGAVSQYNEDEVRGQLHDAAGGAGVHDRDAGVRLRRPVPGGDRRAGRLVPRRQARLARDRRARQRPRLPADAADAVRGGEHRQAGAGARRGLARRGGPVDQVQAAEQGLDDRDRAADVGCAVGDHVAV
jgi:NADPH-dependent curcumin reductase CurA